MEKVNEGAEVDAQKPHLSKLSFKTLRFSGKKR